MRTEARCQRDDNSVKRTATTSDEPGGTVRKTLLTLAALAAADRLGQRQERRRAHLGGHGRRSRCGGGSRGWRSRGSTRGLHLRTLLGRSSHSSARGSAAVLALILA